MPGEAPAEQHPARTRNEEDQGEQREIDSFREMGPYEQQRCGYDEEPARDRAGACDHGVTQQMPATKEQKGAHSVY